MQNKIQLEKFKLQYITNESTRYSHAESVKRVLAGGCKWIQLRMKNADPELMLETATQIGNLCKQYDATFIVDDNVFVAKESDADGVHLGKNDMPIDAAKAVLPENKIIGATANTQTDIHHAVQQGADYIGLGPYKFTTTKQNLSSILGVAGYRNILSGLQYKNGIPIVAIGGIGLEDIEELMRTGVSGVAVSGSILNARDIEEQTRSFLQQPGLLVGRK